MPSPRRKQVADIKSLLLEPATTSHFQTWFYPPPAVSSWIENESLTYGYGIPIRSSEEFFSLLCSDATLPGSSLMTHEQSNDFHGVTQRFAYRKDYGTGVDFSFIVDGNHYMLFLFESWIRYIINEPIPEINTEGYPAVDRRNFYSRVNYPYDAVSGYVSPQGLYINKFERSYEGNFGATYQFIDAYPTAITSIPVSYEASQLLKVTVTFTYTRYYVKPLIYGDPSTPGDPTATPPGDPSPTTSGLYSEDKLIWALTNRGMIESVGTPAQKAILDVALRSDASALRTKAITGSYTTTDRIRGIVSGEGRPIPTSLITFG